MANRAVLLQLIFDSHVQPFYDDLTNPELADVLDTQKIDARTELFNTIRKDIRFAEYNVFARHELTPEMSNNSFYMLIGHVSQALVGKQLTIEEVRKVVADALPDYVYGWKKYQMDEAEINPEHAADIQSMTLAAFQKYVQSPLHGVLTATLHILSSYFNVHIVVTTVNSEGALTVLPQQYTGSLSDNFIIIHQEPGPGTLRVYSKLRFLKSTGRSYAVLSTNTCPPNMCAFLKQTQPPYKNAYKNGVPV
jgi:hypothetical protein